jgi:hypothetical protein
VLSEAQGGSVRLNEAASAVGAEGQNAALGNRTSLAVHLIEDVTCVTVPWACTSTSGAASACATAVYSAKHVPWQEVAINWRDGSLLLVLYVL